MALNPNSTNSSGARPSSIIAAIATDMTTYFAGQLSPTPPGGWGETTPTYTRAPILYKVLKAEDEQSALSMITEPDSGGRLVVKWNGDQPFGGAIREGDIAVNRISLILTRPESLSDQDGDTHLGGSLPFLNLMAALRARVMSYRGNTDATEGFFRYAGTSAVVLPDGFPMAAWEMTFTLKTALPVATGTGEITLNL